MPDALPSRSTPLHGFSEVEAQARLKSEGYNELPRAGRHTPLRIFFDVMREPMLALLVVSGLIYLAIGDPGEAVILIAFARACPSLSRSCKSHAPSAFSRRFVISLAHARQLFGTASFTFIRPDSLPHFWQQFGWTEF